MKALTTNMLYLQGAL